MTANSNKGTYKSPNKLHNFNFILEGEIQYGPTYYKIILNGETISNRNFGSKFKWSMDSRFLAVQEWLTTDYQLGPITSLTIIELETKRITKAYTLNKGFIIPIEFNDRCLIFETRKNNEVSKQELEIDKITSWEEINKK